MKTKIKVYASSQNRIALGVINAYMLINPYLTLDELRNAFPNEINPDCGSKQIFMSEKDIREHVAHGEDWYATARGYFVKDEEWLVPTLEEGRIGFVSMWSKPSYDRLVEKALQYGIEVIESDDKKGSFRLEFVNGFTSPVVGGDVSAQSQNRLALGIAKTFLELYPKSKLDDIQKAFPNEINPDCGSKQIFMSEEEINKHIANGEEWYGTARGYFTGEDEWLVLSDHSKIGFVSMWSKPSMDRLIVQAKKYGITANIDPDIARGSYESVWGVMENSTQMTEKEQSKEEKKTSEDNRVNRFLLDHQDYFPSKKCDEIKIFLEQLDDKHLTIAMSQGYKNPFMMLLISVFWGVLGVDRFLLGQVSIGVLKLLTGGACGIMWIIDMIKIQDMTRVYNYKKLLGLHS